MGAARLRGRRGAYACLYWPSYGKAYSQRRLARRDYAALLPSHLRGLAFLQRGARAPLWNVWRPKCLLSSALLMVKWYGIRSKPTYAAVARSGDIWTGANLAPRENNKRRGGRPRRIKQRRVACARRQQQRACQENHAARIRQRAHQSSQSHHAHSALRWRGASRRAASGNNARGPVFAAHVACNGGRSSPLTSAAILC